MKRVANPANNPETIAGAGNGTGFWVAGKVGNAGGV